MGEKKYNGVKLLNGNKHLRFYEIDALTKSGNNFSYYFVSRENEENIKLNTKERKASGLAVFAVTKELPHRLLMIKQYRYPAGEFIYELPAGLIEEGETDEQAAARELKEETGMDFVPYTGGEAGFRRPFYLAQGISDELDSTVFGYVSGNISSEGLEDSEDIQVMLVDKEEARRIIHEERLSMRAGYLLMMFINVAENDSVFDFLS